MNKEKYQNQKLNEKEGIINKGLINYINEINPVSSELVKKANLRFLVNTNIISYRGKFKIIHKLSNGSLEFF